MSRSVAVTRGIRIVVRAEYSSEHSAPQLSRWFFLYTITIRNESDVTVQLISRHWIIKDADGEIQEVRGLGVVGLQPVIEPGEEFEYTSACPLVTPLGSMEGTYQMVTPTGERFDTAIAKFKLQGPYTVH
ncbi:MAG: Co2+/Mg2+ efflux protein ApaG [Luteitalea sp.]|nr:Co2+/Mg2+ efflux protein ApaG [Luteitalea sp.]